MKYASFTEFMNCEIVRKDNIAKVVLGYYEEEDSFKGLPIYLLGFETDASKSDFEIFEEAWEYYIVLEDIFNGEIKIDEE